MSLPRYPEYKDSGVPWLGAVPAHWGICTLKRVASLRSGESITADSIETEGPYPVYGGNGLRGYTDGFTHEGDFVLVGRQGALCGNVNYANGRFWASEHAVVVTPVKQASITWLGELLRAANLGQYSVSAAQPGLSVDAIASLGVPYPPIGEQLGIARFLGRETARIDALIAEQEKLLALLAEKRQATISHAVTRGLDPNVPMKDSGIDWLGEVPAHWPVVRLKNAVPHVTVGIVVEPSGHYVDEGVPALRSLNVSGGEILMENLVYISQASNEKLSKSKLHAGDLVVVRSGKAGAAAVVPPELDGCNCIDLIIIRKPLRGSEQFLNWYLASDAALRQFEGGSEGAIQKHYNIGTAANLTLPWPSLEEQVEIAQYLDGQVHAIGKLQELTESSLELLKERRSALISAAVTGQIDVRGLDEADAT